MSDRLLYALLALCGASLLSVQFAIKPAFDPLEVRSVAESLINTNAWQNRPADDFELPMRGGGVFRLSEHIGREVIVLNFFATWCEPCREEMPELQYFAKRMAGEKRPLTLLAIDAPESPEKVEAFARRTSLTLPIALDENGRVGGRYGVDGFPTTVVIGADGRIKVYESGRISNADVALTPALNIEFAALAAADSTADARRQAWTEAVAQNGTAGRTGFTPPPTDAGGLTGRALSIAQVMPCPCGCDDTVLKCTCHTAKGIKAKLQAGVPDDQSDGEVMQRLNKEFCMKGM